jgi:hypothetical protein
MGYRAWAIGLSLVVSGLLVGCDDSPPPRNPFDPGPNAAKKPPPIQEVPKPKGPPELHIDSLSPKVGFTRVLLKKPEDREKLAKELNDNREYFSSGDVPLRVDREADPTWVVAMVDEIAALGADRITVRTPTRPEFSQQLRLKPATRVDGTPSCSIVAMVLADRGTAVWRLRGGRAAKRSKGFAGPDLTMTGDTIVRLAKKCKESSTFFLSGAEGVEWGLVFDLGASTLKLKDAKLETPVLLRKPPTPGRRVGL